MTTPTAYKLKILDIAIAAVVIAFTVWSGLEVYGSQSETVRVRIEGSGQSWLYPLTEERTIAVSGPLGDTIVRIENGTARIATSPCPNQTCIAGQQIQHVGDWNACLPNRVLIRGEGDGAEDSEIDIVAR